MIQIKRIYEPTSAQDGYRVLVDRLWPRGISKENAALDEWCQEIAPSAPLRKWFAHQPELFEEFTERYKTELTQQNETLQRLKEISKKRLLTLLYGSKDEKHNQAVVLLHILKNMP